MKRWDEPGANQESFGRQAVKFFIAASVAGTISMGCYLMFEKAYEIVGFASFVAMILTMAYLDDFKKKD